MYCCSNKNRHTAALIFHTFYRERDKDREKSLLLQRNHHLWLYQITERSVFQLLSIMLLLVSQQTSLRAHLLSRTGSHILRTRSCTSRAIWIRRLHWALEQVHCKQIFLHARVWVCLCVRVYNCYLDLKMPFKAILFGTGRSNLGLIFRYSLRILFFSSDYRQNSITVSY